METPGFSPESFIFWAAGAERAAAEDVAATISSELSRLGRELAAYKRISSFDISSEELPKTATRKIRRDAAANMARPL
jgi:acyl-CoA synthetase (AMP-forming)/AMP-acid ligase II